MKLIIKEDFATVTTEIYGEIEKGNKTYIIGYDGRNLIEHELPETPFANKKKIRPLLIIPSNMLKDIVAGFVEYAQKNDIRTENQHLLEGKMIATERHLSDMQEFAKKLLDAQLEITPK